jgi:hypothetical protein
MFYILLARTRSTRAATALALLYAFATPVFYRTGQLSHNLLVGHSALFAFALLWRPWEPSSRPRGWHYLLAGFLAGWAVVLDYSGIVVLLGIGLYALARWWALPATGRRFADLALFAFGAIISLSILAGYQWVAFGHPFLPAQSYMPAANFTDAGYRGMTLPQPDLFWETAFGIRIGLFVSAPILLLAFYVPGWLRPQRLVGSREAWFVFLYTVAFFLFAAANQYGRMQFNSGVRYVVPVTPFLFLIVAGVLLKMPRWLAVTIGFVATYWSWCLAMYRDVEQGWGVFESVIHITREGVRLPWLKTLELMGYLPQGLSALPILLLTGAVVWVLWSVRFPSVAAGRRFGWER